MRRFFTHVLFINLMLLSSCFLDQYNDNKSVTLKLKFPTASKSSSGALTKPAGADYTYIPPFIDKIEFSLLSDEYQFQKTMTRSENNLTTLYDLGIIPFGEYSLDVKAYICTSNCEAPADDDFTLTHRFYNPKLILGGLFETYQIDAELAPDLTNIDETVGSNSYVGVNIDDAPEEIIVDGIDPYTYVSFVPPYAKYCTAINNNGDFAIAWVESLLSTNLERMILKIYNNHREEIFDSEGHDFMPDTTTDEEILELTDSCAFIGNTLLIPFYGSPSFQIFSISHPYANAAIHPVSGNWLRLQNSSFIDSNYDYSVIAWLSPDWKPHFKTARIANGTLSLSNEVNPQFKATELKIKILNDGNFIVYGIDLETERIIGQKFKENGQTASDKFYLSPPSEIPSNPACDKCDYFSLADMFGIYQVAFDTVIDDYPDYDIHYSTSNSGSTSSILPNIPYSSHRQSLLKNYRGDNLAMVWTDTMGGNGYYKIFHTLNPRQGPFPHTNLFLPNCPTSSNTVSYNAGSPHLEINDDGFAVISWFAFDGLNVKLYFKRFVF